MTKDKDNIIMFPGTEKKNISKQQIDDLVEETNYQIRMIDRLAHKSKVLGTRKKINIIAKASFGFGDVNG